MKLITVFIVLCFSCNSNIESFDLCTNTTKPYYYPSLKYKGDFYEIKTHYYTNFIPTTNGYTGFVKISFQVNCRGETGNYTMDRYTLDYKRNPLGAKVSEQFLHLTKELKDWIPARDEETGEQIDSHKFFMFKLKNGELVDVLPK